MPRSPFSACGERLLTYGASSPAFRSTYLKFQALTSHSLVYSGQSAIEGVNGKEEVGQAWLLSSKIARKAGHSQTAYSAVLQARQYSTPFTFVQDAKLLYTTGQNLRALQELQHSLDPIITSKTLDKGSLAKVSFPIFLSHSADS